MKIFIFCIMTMLNDDVITYQYKESFTSGFECLKQAEIEADRMRTKDTSEQKDIEFFCGTSKQFVSKYL